MNPYSHATVSDNLADTINTRAFLQQAVDHYPRLAAFSFTLTLPYRETMTDYHALILRFHSEVWLRTGEYSRERQQERRHSPPTLLRWLWESASAPACRMVLLLNLDTLGAGGQTRLAENSHQAISEIIRDAWQTVTGVDHDGITNMTPMIINRAVRGAFTTPFNQLKALVQTMHAPVATARTGVAG
ncbi:TPA: inovirus-type Gp2 protein [Salmonella enterica]|nr:inovirus-type Gp2 protein [Salmonella enterica]MCH5736000.1 inovirus-type Gp2 protein [Salmonella enterica]MCH5741733.1 inovirus-type Gp2 protein [Salmonella enterica]MCH5745723.1 inovirus-type Gp2 protein [Salmonella enterica]MCH5755351.1 inovirus-type Gp2 protein [Salmonella enterica]